MSASTHPSELAFFSTLAAAGGLSAAARQMGISTPAVSKRLALMEARLGVTLVTRTTRRMHLTPEGELYLMHARRILTDIGDMEQQLADSQAGPRGLLRVNASPGFGRGYVAPLLARFKTTHPDVQIQLQLSVNPPALIDDMFDVCIRFGQPPDARVIARRLASNRRLLCAAPDYLALRGAPKTPDDLAQHDCIDIHQGGEAYGVWRLISRHDVNAKSHSVRVHSGMTTNDGEVAVKWALDGLGILMRAEWDISRYLKSGRLVQVLPDYQTPDADIYAVYAPRHQLSRRIRAFVDFAVDSFAD
jgi:DNA-binding transcriptional LysR family regulator